MRSHLNLNLSELRISQNIQNLFHLLFVGYRKINKLLIKKTKTKTKNKL